jgi:hypothetical protein
MKHTPITAAEILALRKALPGIIAWLRERESYHSHSSHKSQL